MNNQKPLYSTKNHGNGMRNVTLICGLIMLVFGVLLWASGLAIESLEQYERYSSEESVFIGIALYILPFIIALLAFVMSFRYSGTYLDIYEDHIEGKGLVGIKYMHSIYFTYDKIGNVTAEKSYLCIHADGKNFKISTTKEKAEEFFRFIKSKMQ